MHIKGIYRQDMYELPVDGIRELIANAVTHRSYLEPGNIQVALYDDRLEITSPGMLLNNVSIRKIMEGYSKLRNPAIASAFAYMKIIEKWGTGIPRIFRECAEYDLPKPQLLDFDGDFRVNMYRKTTQTIVSNFSDLTDDDNVILNALLQNNRLTQKEIASKLEWSVDRVKYYLQKLKKKGVIKRLGSSHNGYWGIIVK